MLMTVAELRQFVSTDETDQALEVRLQALESALRAYTNNNFQNRAFRSVAVAVDDHTLIVNGAVPYKVGDTLQITDSELQNNTLITVSAVSGDEITVSEDIYSEGGVIITKVVYPADIKMGVCNLISYDLNQRDKIGIASETISRHSVSYVNVDASNTILSYPSAMVGFLKPYIKARFGQGLRV